LKSAEAVKRCTDSVILEEDSTEVGNPPRRGDQTTFVIAKYLPLYPLEMDQ
jgi:hypothetical protein